jgi:hypothetical protein
MHGDVDLMVCLYFETNFGELAPDERIKLLCHVIFCDFYGMSYISLIVSFRQLAH